MWVAFSARLWYGAQVFTAEAALWYLRNVVAQGPLRFEPRCLVQNVLALKRRIPFLTHAISPFRSMSHDQRTCCVAGRDKPIAGHA